MLEIVCLLQLLVVAGCCCWLLQKSKMSFRVPSRFMQSFVALRTGAFESVNSRVEGCDGSACLLLLDACLFELNSVLDGVCWRHDPFTRRALLACSFGYYGPSVAREGPSVGSGVEEEKAALCMPMALGMPMALREAAVRMPICIDALQLVHGLTSCQDPRLLEVLGKVKRRLECVRPLLLERHWVNSLRYSVNYCDSLLCGCLFEPRYWNGALIDVAAASAMSALGNLNWSSNGSNGIESSKRRRLE